VSTAQQKPEPESQQGTVSHLQPDDDSAVQQLTEDDDDQDDSVNERVSPLPAPL